MAPAELTTMTNLTLNPLSFISLNILILSYTRQHETQDKNKQNVACSEWQL